MSEREENVSARPGKMIRVLRGGAFTLLALCVAGTGFTVLRQSAEIQSLRIAVGQAPGRDAVQQELDQLGERVSRNGEALKNMVASLKAVKGMPVVDKTAFEQLVQQVRQLESRERQAMPSGLAATMALLQTRVDALEKEKRAVGKQSAQPASSAGAVAPAVKKTPPRRARAITAPFRVTGIERRGGSVVVAVAPLRAFSLADIRLIETGETFQGWTLQSAAGNQAQFSVAGRTQSLNVQ
ncbi:hypothetical protein J0B02_11850 [Enterobacteriaceae bacterium YMB-R22]|jgi:hypothetical protein|uniref:hypothetical protein n=1 Tax=Tenebrionicola larvae TaxID=2815733 RepID=UPI0020127D2C|nr:hypothetical protein [Tenebrionicola larvae]MBV4413508.1 hypothetical protein [Tenebrionicola larvae]